MDAPWVRMCSCRAGIAASLGVVVATTGCLLRGDYAAAGDADLVGDLDPGGDAFPVGDPMPSCGQPGSPVFAGAERAQAVGPHSLRVYWTPAAAASPVVYWIYAATGIPSLDATPQGAGAGSSGMISGLAEATSYQIVVRAQDREGRVDCNVVVVTASTTDAAGMVLISLPTLEPFLIDAFEASEVPASGSWGNDDQGRWPDGNDGSTTLRLASLAGATPARNMTYFQAQAACLNSGKRLCSETEWRAACRGGSDTLYPYGNTYAAGVCNDWNYLAGDAIATATLRNCVNDYGLFDMVGNVWEITRSVFEIHDRGGAYDWEPVASCDATGFMGGPTAKYDHTGVRCCADDV